MSWKYRPTPGARLSTKQVDQYGPVLYKLQEERRLGAKALVAEGRVPGNPLNDYFEWNDGVAGELYREEQARYLIRGIHIVRVDDSTGRETSIRAFVIVKAEEGDSERPFVAIGRAIAQEEMWEFVLEEVRSWLRSAQRKLRAFGKLEPADMIETVIEKLKPPKKPQGKQLQATTK